LSTNATQELSPETTIVQVQQYSTMPIRSNRVSQGPVRCSPPSSPRFRPVIITVLSIVIVGLISQPSNNSVQSKGLLIATVPRTLVSTGSNAEGAVNPGKYPIFDCAKLLEDLVTNPAMQELDPNMGKIYSRRVTENPSFYVSLHNRTFDHTRWSVMLFGHYYEITLTNAFQEVLRESPPGSRVLDVGGEYFFGAVRMFCCSV
jgi:hypothetical protein